MNIKQTSYGPATLCLNLISTEEKVVANQLCDFYTKMVYLKFTSQVLECTIAHETASVKNNLLIASDKGLKSVLVMLDCSAVFDTTDHRILSQRLEHCILKLVMEFDKVMCLDQC